jgi:formylglycine-generating enzyme required for sulfatase activity
MLPEKYESISFQFEPGDGDPDMLLRIAHELEAENNLEGAATVYDRAYGVDPQREDVRQARARVLDQLAVFEHGIPFRYIPAGAFLMGFDHGEPDERPWHPVWLSAYWMAETPMSWDLYCQLMGWEAPPRGAPKDHPVPAGDIDRAIFYLHQANKIRLQYCEDQTTRARDWHSHNPSAAYQSAGGVQTGPALFGSPSRKDPNAPWQYTAKPMVAVAWQEAEDLASQLSTATVKYGLPSEAQWEKAARGGLIAARYAWGDDPPTPEQCDFDRYYQFSILPMTTFPANGYGLYAVNGCVWEWTRDWYDRHWYGESAHINPEGPPTGEEKTLRGGSWADCAEVVTVSFRMSRESNGWKDEKWGRNLSPNIGFRLCRTILEQGNIK